MNLTISVACADVIDFSCDILVLKYAQSFYGADAVVANLLRPNRLESLSPAPGRYTLLASQGKLPARNVLFVGVLPLNQFDYAQIRNFSMYSLRVLAQEKSEAEHVAMTMHGIGYGMDERESFLAQLGGVLEAINSNFVHRSLKRITIVERNPGRALRLQQVLEETLSSVALSELVNQFEITSGATNLTNAGLRSNDKPHVFVAMPFSEEMEDVYTFGIQGPINAAGFLCERVDMTTFMGDILDRIKSRIETASLVIADLTGSNPNVYLEVGYAWGTNRPTILLVNKADELKFDVRGQKCIVYKNISDLAKRIEPYLAALK